MHDYMMKRVVREALTIIENPTTVRELAKQFKVSKSTIHSDLTTRLSEVNPTLFTSVNDILQKNKKERHIRGGEATRRKYMNKRK